MKYDSLHLIYFSPTHTSAKIAYAVARGLGIAEVHETDLTFPSDETILSENELAVIAVPVYGGRVAETAMERLKNVTAKNSPVILTVLYGNRDYEDALLELRDCAVSLGFTPVAGSAFIGEHSYSRPGRPVAEDRPDMHDEEIARQFGHETAGKLLQYGSLSEIPALQVKGNFPYKVKGTPTPATPVTEDNLCTQCEYCIMICPTECISVNDAQEIASDPTRCIKCCACVKECPNGARVFDTPYTDMLFNNFSTPRHPELFCLP